MSSKENYKSTDVYEIYIENDIIIAGYHKPTIVDLKVSKDILKDRQAIANGKAYPILGRATNVKYWTQDAKNFHSSEEYSNSVKAVALVFNSTVLTVLLNFYIKFYKCRFPLKAFTVEKEALEWLEKFKD